MRAEREGRLKIEGPPLPIPESPKICLSPDLLKEVQSLLRCLSILEDTTPGGQRRIVRYLHDRFSPKGFNS